MRALSLIATFCISLPLGFLALSLSLSNRDVITLTLWPFQGSVDWQVGAAGAVVLGIGFLAGAAFVSIFSQRLRYRAWQQDRRIARLEADLKTAEEKCAALTVPPVPAPAPVTGTQAALRDVEIAPYGL